MSLRNPTKNTSLTIPAAAKKKLNAFASFKLNVFKLVQRGHQHLIKTNRYKRFSKNWNEDHYSANLKASMEKVRNVKTRFHISFNPPQISQALLQGKQSLLAAPKIDFELEHLGVAKTMCFGLEAKIISEFGYGSRSSKELAKGYVEKGMDRFITGY